MSLKKTQIIVEATSFERHTLWQEWFGRKRKYWEDLISHGVNVGYTPDKRPVFICLSWSIVSGVYVMFLEPTSVVVDWKMIEDWLEINCPGARKIGASNFHQVFSLESQGGMDVWTI